MLKWVAPALVQGLCPSGALDLALPHTQSRSVATLCGETHGLSSLVTPVQRLVELLPLV